TAPGTIPPPSTRSSSPTPVGTARETVGSIRGSGTAGEDGARAVRARPVAPAAAGSGAVSSNVPQLPQPAHRPAHLGAEWLHSVQRKFTLVRATVRSIGAGSDRTGDRPEPAGIRGRATTRGSAADL